MIVHRSALIPRKLSCPEKFLVTRLKTKNINVAELAEFIKTCDQNPPRFNFGHFLCSIILPVSVISFCLGVMIRTWRRVLLGVMSENDQIQMYWPVILTRKVFPKHDGVNGFEKTFKKYSGDINPSGVHRNMRRRSLKSILKDWAGNRQYVCLPLYWSWPEGWDILRKRRGSKKWRRCFWNRGYKHLYALTLEVE